MSIHNLIHLIGFLCYVIDGFFFVIIDFLFYLNTGILGIHHNNYSLNFCLKFIFFFLGNKSKASRSSEYNLVFYSEHYASCECECGCIENKETEACCSASAN